MLSSCPVCEHKFSLSEIERHVNDHFDEELVRDIELSQYIAYTPTSTRVEDGAKNLQKAFGEAPEDSTSNSSNNAGAHGETFHGEKISCLVSVQIKSVFYRIEEGLMTLLRKCLESERGKSISYITGHIDHFQGIYSDSGWGCGWRNIQMLSSHLLASRREAREVMYGGSGFVPDILSLQRWLEIAWERGFDTPGSNSFNHKIYGSRKWIGTTECAALFRFFGLRARVVDFGSKMIEMLSPFHDKNTEVEVMESKRKSEQVYVPMDKFVLSKGLNVSKMNASVRKKTCHANNTLQAQAKLDKFRGKKNDCHQFIVKWLWKYFTGEHIIKKDNYQRVFVSQRTPLYFQHDGHSRTIVGIQRHEGRGGSSEHYSLLVLDPGHRTLALKNSLLENFGWQKFIKRGVHTLRKPQYQLCYVDPGIARGDEMEQLKTIDSIFFEF